MRRVMTILSTVFFLATFCTIALGDVVPGAVLYLDARDNPAHPDAWTNLGTAGGELPGADEPPELLEEGTIEIPGIGFTLEDAKYYTTTGPSQTFGGSAEMNPDLFLEHWTVEFLCKRNGDPWDMENALAGLMPGATWENGIFIMTYDAEGTDDFGISHAPTWSARPEGIKLLEGEWTWMTFTGDESEVVAYKDGEEVGRGEGWTFDKTLAVDGISIFGQAHEVRNRTFNGSLAIFRVYDKVLSAAEVKRNIEAVAAVDPASKLTTTWGREKTRY